LSKCTYAYPSELEGIAATQEWVTIYEK